MLLIKGKNILTDGTLALLIFDRNLIPMPFPVITRILSISVSQTWKFNFGFNPPFLWKCLYQVRAIAVFPSFPVVD
jgi:hypothetical protein